MTWKELVEETEREIGELSNEQLLALRCIFEAHFNTEDPRENNSLKIEK